MEVDKKLYEEIKEYCKLNGLKPSEYVNATLKRAFMEDKYGDAPFLKKDSHESVMHENKAFEDAVNAEVRRILNDKEEMKKFLSGENSIANDIQSNSTRVTSFVEVPVGGPDRNGRVYPEEVVKEAVDKFNRKFFKGTDELDTAMRKFNETFFHGMKEAEETEKEISEYMEKNNIEPVSMEELIYGYDESGQVVQKNVQIPENTQKSDINLDKEPKKRTIKPIR